MKNTSLLPRLLAVIVLTTGLSVSALLAQTPATGDVVVVHVQGLTSGMRDAITSEARDGGQMELAYACVPAGILVFVPANAGGRDEARGRSLALAGRHVANAAITELPIGRQEAEERCAQARGQR